jgi:hypothetical protein
MRVQQERIDKIFGHGRLLPAFTVRIEEVQPQGEGEGEGVGMARYPNRGDM